MEDQNVTSTMQEPHHIEEVQHIEEIKHVDGVFDIGLLSTFIVIDIVRDDASAGDGDSARDGDNVNDDILHELDIPHRETQFDLYYNPIEQWDDISDRLTISKQDWKTKYEWKNDSISRCMCYWCMDDRGVHIGHGKYGRQKLKSKIRRNRKRVAIDNLM